MYTEHIRVDVHAARSSRNRIRANTNLIFVERH